jgi:hypothetical protein
LIDDEEQKKKGEGIHNWAPNGQQANETFLLLDKRK